MTILQVFVLQPWSKEAEGMTEDLLKYIEVMKQETGLEIGIHMNADELMIYYDNPKFPCKCLLNVNSYLYVIS